MPSGEERARDAALLAYLREPTTERAQDDQEVQEVRANLLRGVLPRRPPRTDDAFVRALLPRNRRATGPYWGEARLAARDWRKAGVTAEEVGAWLATGAYPEEGALVALLLLEGITAQRAGRAFQHPVTGEQVTILDVARDELSGKPWGTADLCRALDEAGIERQRRPGAAGRRRIC